MAGYKFFNIGKANAEIERLEAENAALKAAKPAAGPEAGQLAEALASNEQVSKQLEQANSDLSTARQTISTLTCQVETAQGQVNAIGACIKAGCVALKIEVPANATGVEMVALLQNSIPTLAAKEAQKITARTGAPPAPVAATGATDPADKKQTGMSRLAAAAKADLATHGYARK